MSSYGWVIAPPPWRRGPQVRAPWHHRAMGPSTSWDQWPRSVTRAVGTQECTQIGQNGLSASFWGIRVHCWAVAPLRTGAGTQECTQIDGNGPSEPFWDICVHCCDASRDTNCDASSARWHERPNRHGVPAAPPLGGYLSLGREGRLYASGAAARLASSPRRQPTQTPEEPIHGQAFRRSYCHSPRAQ